MVAPVNPVQQRQTVRQNPSKTSRGLGNALGATGGLIAAASGGGFSGNLAGVTSGRMIGQFVGESIDPSGTEVVQSPVATQIGDFKISQNGQLYAEALRILQNVPPEVAQPHSKALTAALMADLAQTNGRSA